ncbi:hypothetical protein SAMN05444340_11545 [Citreimonas salinaria]|uniref:DNA ligase (ATP) n=2 Tax=Citreimonas salinaria TaxID=321339 RepID=A0A1H3M217_9RHOB|nr:hypothetical protein SAMN05444340_11545 [Citreimonas salinaria]
MAKSLALTYQPGKRAMLKYKVWKTADCVLGGIYHKKGTRSLDFLLLGLYDGEGLLHYVGRARIPTGGEAMGGILEQLAGEGGFTGRRPGSKDRWSGAERDYVPLRPLIVAEVSTELVSADFMRHGARVLRIRQDKNPDDCSIDQIR